MKKITCVQQYVIDNLIEDEKLSTNSLLDAISKVCSEEQFNSILSILIETPIPCANTLELEYEKDAKGRTELVAMSMYIPKEIDASIKTTIVRKLDKTLSIGLKEAKDFVNLCIGEHHMFPGTLLQKDVKTLIKELEPYNVIINMAEVNLS